MMLIFTSGAFLLQLLMFLIEQIFPGSSPPAGGGRATYNKCMYYVYAVYNAQNKKYYIGQTRNLDIRINLHNNRTFKGCYTSRFSGDWKLFYKEEFNSRIEALTREKQLKSYRGREFLKNCIPW